MRIAVRLSHINKDYLQQVVMIKIFNQLISKKLLKLID